MSTETYDLTLTSIEFSLNTSLWSIELVDSALRSLRRIDVGSVTDVSEINVISIFSVEDADNTAETTVMLPTITRYKDT
jgi:hypothetical protein